MIFLQLKHLLREADPAEDFTVDAALREACQPVVDTVCKGMKPGDARYVLRTVHITQVSNLMPRFGRIYLHFLVHL